jgi:Tfp pilus assembly protein PilO
MEKMRQWSILTAVGVIAVLAAGWFLLVSPQRSHATDLRSQAASQQSANDGLRARVAQLEAQKKGLPAQQRLLDEIAAKIPASPELPALIRQLSTAAEAAGVDLVTLAPTAPTAVTVTAPAAPVTTAPATDTAATTGTPAAAPVPAASSLMQIPVSVTVRGTYFNLTSFFRNVEKMDRGTLVSGWKISPVESAGPSTSGNAAASDAPAGELTATLSTIVFESPVATAPVTPTAAQ